MTEHFHPSKIIPNSCSDVAPFASDARHFANCRDRLRYEIENQHRERCVEGVVRMFDPLRIPNLENRSLIRYIFSSVLYKLQSGIDTDNRYTANSLEDGSAQRTRA